MQYALQFQLNGAVDSVWGNRFWDGFLSGMSLATTDLVHRNSMKCGKSSNIFVFCWANRWTLLQLEYYKEICPKINAIELVDTKWNINSTSHIHNAALKQREQQCTTNQMKTIHTKYTIYI